VHLENTSAIGWCGKANDGQEPHAYVQKKMAELGAQMCTDRNGSRTPGAEERLWFVVEV